MLANEQTRGKGRRGRAFASPQDNGIYLSILFHPDTLPTDIVEITAWTAVATNNAIEEVCGVRAGIKWVNDLVIDRKKICGILTEMSVESESGYIQYLIIGIGINVNGQAEDFPAEIRSTATSLAMETGKTHSRAALAAGTDSGGWTACDRAWPKEKRNIWRLPAGTTSQRERKSPLYAVQRRHSPLRLPSGMIFRYGCAMPMDEARHFPVEKSALRDYIIKITQKSLPFSWKAFRI